MFCRDKQTFSPQSLSHTAHDDKILTTAQAFLKNTKEHVHENNHQILKSHSKCA